MFWAGSPMDQSLFSSDPNFESGSANGGRKQVRHDIPKPFTVSQAAELIRGVLADGLPSTLQVIGEVSNFSGRQHWFFSLKDQDATLSCVCFASAARRVVFPMTNGLQVVATGRIDYYDAQGRLQLYVDKIEPVGQGALELQFRALCERLREKGYFDLQRKKSLPLIPRCVAVITSCQAAALQDVINTAQRRWPGCRLMLFDVRVQGDGAAPQISAAIQALSHHGASLNIDAIILTRGGGSIEDLWAFNEPIVAEAIFQCDLPIVAAIGHETDTTIAELVADMRCATPTQAAMTLIPDQHVLEQQIEQLTRRLGLLLKRKVELSRQRFHAVQQHPIFRRPQRMTELISQRLDGLAHRLQATVPKHFEQCRQRLELLAKHLESVGPTNVLSRGYSYTLSADGRVVRSTDEVAQGDRITTVVAQGQMTSIVEELPGNASSKRNRSRSSRGGNSDNQEGI